jgi:intein-encoded DNA endonuclease-like protein
MDNSIIERYEKGEAFTKIAKSINKSANYVKRILKLNNIKIRNLSQSHEIYSYDKDYFKKIDSEEKAYILGFLYADGNVCKNVMQICLHKKDEEILCLIKKGLKSNHKIVNDRGYVRFRIGNEELVKDLLNQGLHERKTFTLEFPNENILPLHLQSHFIRGYFDGDGCIKHGEDKKYNYTTWGFEIISCFNFLTEINKILARDAGINLANLNREKRRENPIYYLRHGGTSIKRILLIYNYLYKNSSCFLKRKKQKFDFIINQLKKQDA